MRAVYWGFGAAILHRLVLTIWLGIVWSVVGANLGVQVDFHTAGAALPPLASPAEAAIFGVWRRWDAVHYLDLAANGYRIDHPGPTVFGVLTPLGIRAFDAVLPGSLDLAAMIFEILAFGLALTLLYKVGETYYNDAELGRWTLIITALLPLSYFFAAPISESIYLALALGMVYFGARRQWIIAAICASLATLARSQGVLLLPVAGLLLLEQNGFNFSRRDQWIDQLRLAVRQGWALALIPAAYFGFLLYRGSLGLPPLETIYRDYSYVYLTNPLDGLITNLRWLIEHFPESLQHIDLWALVTTLILSVTALRFRQHRRLPLIAYTFGHILLFVSKINYQYGTDDVIFSQSFARYALALFPLTFLVTDGVQRAHPLARVAVVTLLMLGFFAFSALYVLALTGP